MTIQWADNYDYFGGENAKMQQGLYLTLGSAFSVGYAESRPELVAFDPGKYWMRVFGRGTGWSRVLPAGVLSAIGFATRIYMVAMPTNNVRVTSLVELRSNVQDLLARIQITPAGNLQVINNVGTVVAQTVVPCIVLNTAHKIQAQFTMHATLGEVEVRVDGVAKIGGASGVNGENLVMPGSIGIVAQQIDNSSSSGAGGYYTDFFVPYSLTGTYNDDWPNISGVTTLWPNEVTEEDNFTPRPYERFGIGVFDNRSVAPAFDTGPECLSAAQSTDFDLTTGDYTLEGSFRWSVRPTTTQVQTLFAKWNPTSDEHSYRLVLNGPDVNDGSLQLQVSPDGTLGSAVSVFELQWSPAIGHWYHIAVSRNSGVTRIFIDGIQLGVDYADANDYFDASSPFGVGGSLNTANTVVNALNGMFDEVRITNGVGRYTTNFTPPTTIFPRSVLGGDPDFADVVLLAGFDESIADLSNFARTLTARGGAARLVPDDGAFSFYTVDQYVPYDDRFLESPFQEASGVFRLDALPADTETVTLGASVYTFNTVLGAAGSVLIGADVAATLLNLQNAINNGPGEGTTYGTGTAQNASASAALGPDVEFQLTATALVAGTAGNAIVSTTTAVDGSWTDTTLDGGVNIPDPVEYGLDALPIEATGLRALILMDRSFVDVDNASLRKSFVVDGDAALGNDNPLTVTPTYRFDVIEEDPDTTAGLTPQSVLVGRIRLARTA